MKLFKPEWVHHDEKPIYSIDIHPDGTKFATGGQGTDSGRVVIWNLAPVISEQTQSNESMPRILCQLDNHLACVNCVRWSGDGTTLASAGDDKIIMLWKRGKGPTAVFGNSGITKTTENWRCTSTLRGHSGDILDLAWSPQDRWLASSSVDNNIIVWDMNNLPTMVTNLKGHKGLVKGITWDPVGKYLASQSDDRSVKIWRTGDWVCESTITEPFEECSGTTHVLRLSWSPDGLYLVSSHAMNGGGPTAQIIEREGWKYNNDFVGHRKAVTCVRFHQSILKRQEPSKNKSQQYCCLAIGSRDKSVSVWLTALQRPLVVIYDLFEDTVLDLSWSTGKHILMACSTDGTIACVMFSEEELGTALSQEDKNNIYQRMYGKSANIDLSDSHADKNNLIEYAELLDTKNDAATAKEDTNLTNNNNSNNTNEDVVMNTSTNHVNSNSFQAPNKPVTPTKAIHKQIESRTADGKRRITPMFIPMNQDSADTNSSQEPELSSSSRSTTNILIVEKKMNEQLMKPPSTTIVLSNKTSEPARSEPLVNRSTINDSDNNAFLDHRLSKSAPIKSSGINTVDGKATDAAGVGNQQELAPTHLPIRLNAGKATAFTAPVVKVHSDFKIQVLNGNLSTPFGQLTKVACTTGTNSANQLWEIFVGSPIVSFCLCSKYVLLCSLDGTLRFINIKNGILILPIVKLFTPAVQCVFSINSELGAVVTECASIRIWNLTEKTNYLSAACNDLLNSGGVKSVVTYFHVTESGVPFILLSNGSSYSYCKKLESWLLLNSRDPITRFGISTKPNNPSKSIKIYPLGSVQAAAGSYTAIKRNVDDVSNGAWKTTAKLSFIENQIQICESIKSPVELEFWYSALGSHLAQHGTEKRLRILLDELLGSSLPYMTSRAQKNPKVDKILGIDKHTLLKKVLEHLKPVPKWQRIYMEYSEQINENQTNTHDLNEKRRKLDNNMETD